MVMANRERISQALDLFRDGLRPKCEQAWSGYFGADWLSSLTDYARVAERDPSLHDVSFLLRSIKATWNEVFAPVMPTAVRSMVFEIADARNNWAHQGSFSSDDVLRALDSMERVLDAFGDRDSQVKIRGLRKDLTRQMLDEEGRSERRKTAAKPTEGTPQSGLAPWRQVITPHSDVASGLFEQAEFAADLYEVSLGQADEEYQDPKAFYSRTFLTKGLRDLLIGAARRLSGQGGDPVIELQTNFGGGKTHSMIALYHLASGIPAAQLTGVGEALAEEGISLPGDIKRATLVGQKISPAAPLQVEDDVRLHTLWGHLAYQLGGRDAYELVRVDDEAGTNPGSALNRLFKQCGPAIVLIDEWVAYARQLRDGGDSSRLAGGDFDTQFTFAQALTEAAASVPNVVLLISVPASVIETGGERGQIALEKLRNVVTRTAAQWQPASPDESFEIVRRRLFDPISADNARVRDGVLRAFSDLYRNQPREFPPNVSEATYRKRMELSYPIHPELFDRLFGEWSTLDKFQRTRGVLRLMALAISELWQRGDQSLLISSATLPMDSPALVSELKKYLEEAWDPVIKSDVDGPNSLPLKIDSENPHFGRLSATRRAARSVYMGSAARPDGSRGVDIRSVLLGCVQPGEPTGQFSDALNRLSGLATHVYVDGSQFWYSLQPNVTRIASDRAASNFSDRDADDETKRRLLKQSGRGTFASVQVFAEGPGDVPDDDQGVRLVVLAPSATHTGNDKESSAIELADRILSQRDGGPRLNRNMLVFVAATSNRLAELRQAARMHLAWQSIVDGYEGLNLTPHQLKQATNKAAETSSQVDALIGEAFVSVLCPTQQPGTSTIEWAYSKASTNGDVADRVSTRLASEERLIAAYGGVRVRMDADRYSLWSERNDIAIRDLWATYARYPHMPRLASPAVLLGAVSDGTSNLNWAQETFAYAEAHDGSTWVGMRKAQHLDASLSALIVHPSVVVEGVTASKSQEAAEVDSSGAAQQPTTASVTPNGTDVTSFYALFALDSVRAIRDLGEILENVTKRLGPDVELALEIRANNEAGFDDKTRRIVSENARNLGASSAEFE